MILLESSVKILCGRGHDQWCRHLSLDGSRGAFWTELWWEGGNPFAFCMRISGGCLFLWHLPLWAHHQTHPLWHFRRMRSDSSLILPIISILFQVWSRFPSRWRWVRESGQMASWCLRNFSAVSQGVSPGLPRRFEFHHEMLLGTSSNCTTGLRHDLSALELPRWMTWIHQETLKLVKGPRRELLGICMCQVLEWSHSIKLLQQYLFNFLLGRCTEPNFELFVLEYLLDFVPSKWSALAPVGLKTHLLKICEGLVYRNLK